MILSLFAGWDIRGYNMHIVSVPPPGQKLMVPAIGIGLVSPTPLSLYPQVGGFGPVHTLASCPTSSDLPLKLPALVARRA